ncbi:Canalicular multispecific organic anion transporter 1, partial [Coemansia sp. RSA 521]
LNQWKSIASLITANVLLGVAMYYRRLVFVNILAQISDQAQTGMGSIVTLLIVWQLLASDVYIFDDLLSAVDAHVERHIIENVLVAGGIISSKTRILVTHAEHVIPLSDKVVTLTNGQVQEKD